MSLNKNLVITILGTGIIGAPVARNLSKNGFKVRVWNRTASKAQVLICEGIEAFDTPTEAVQGADIIVTCLKDGRNVETVIKQALPSIRKGKIWLQLSTVGIEATDSLSQLADSYDVIFYDAPIQGTRQPAEMAKLIILASGPKEQREIIQPIFNAIGQHTLWVSEKIGLSSRLKLSLNHWAFTLTHGLAESLALAKGLGVEPSLVVEVVTGGPMDSGYFQAKSKAILDENYDTNFSVINALKDSALVVNAANRAGLKLDLAEASLARFERAMESGHGTKDMAASYLADTKE